MAADLAAPNGPRRPLRPREHEGTDHREPGTRVAAVGGATDCAHPEASRYVPKLPVLVTFEGDVPGFQCHATDRTRTESAPYDLGVHRADVLRPRCDLCCWSQVRTMIRVTENPWPGRPRTCRCTPRSRSRTPGLRGSREPPPISNLPACHRQDQSPSLRAVRHPPVLGSFTLIPSRARQRLDGLILAV